MSKSVWGLSQKFQKTFRWWKFLSKTEKNWDRSSKKFFPTETNRPSKMFLVFVCSKFFGFKKGVSRLFLVFCFIGKVQKLPILFAISAKVFICSAFENFSASPMFCHAEDSPCCILGMYPVHIQCVG